QTLGVGPLAQGQNHGIGAAGSGRNGGHLGLAGGILVGNGFDHRAGVLAPQGGEQRRYLGRVLRLGAALPGQRPAAREVGLGVGRGAHYQQALDLAGGEGQGVFLVFEQHDRLAGGFQGVLLVLGCPDAAEAVGAGQRVLKQAQLFLHLQHAAGREVDARLGEAAFLHQLFHDAAEVGVVGRHGHVDARVDAPKGGFLLVGLGFLHRHQAQN
nr:hypothetical protein [Tanacetum cinerariifolium]